VYEIVAQCEPHKDKDIIDVAVQIRSLFVFVFVWVEREREKEREREMSFISHTFLSVILTHSQLCCWFVIVSLSLC
jgi:hypothetical protein